MDPKITHLTVRVYGLLIVDQAVLLSREVVKGQAYTKFPGGGLELGEGLHDCVVREFREEAGIAVQPMTHVYTTDHFVRSAFGPSTQVLSVYYLVESDEADAVKTGDPADQSLLRCEGDQVLFWQPLASLEPEQMDLPLDKLVVQSFTG